MPLSQLQPASLWHYFSVICSIPHPSKHEEVLVAFILEEAQKFGVIAERDRIGNVRLSKSASPGCESAIPMVLQSHIDMVPQKNAGTEHDFETDPIQAYVDGDWVTAKGTTLGADNGIGVAAILAVMFSQDLQHGPIEALLTVDEEAGMTGAFELKEDWFDGKLLLNLDTEEEGELYVGCAGGVDVNVRWPVELISTQSNVSEAIKISVTGLKGGHSGIDIHKGRGNANKLLNRVLLMLSQQMEIAIVDLQGGTLRNAIPREAFATIVIPQEAKPQLDALMAPIVDDIDDEYSFVESDLSIDLSSVALPDFIMDQQATLGLLHAILACPNGVLRNSDRFEGVVETSSNLGIISLECADEDQSDKNEALVSLKFMTRSLKDHARDSAVQRIRSCFELIGAEVEATGAYPGWSPSENPALLESMQSVYQSLYASVPNTQIIHAGLECGLLGAKYPHWDMISFGPTITGAHSPDEQVNIPSVEKFWDYLVATLKHFSNKETL